MTEVSEPETPIPGELNTGLSEEELDALANSLIQGQNHVAGKMEICAEQRIDLEIRTARALEAIRDVYNDPDVKIFVRKMQLSRVLQDENGIPAINVLEIYSLTGVLARCCSWYVNEIVRNETTGVKEQVRQRINPKKDVVMDILSKGSYPDIPVLEGLVEAPYITKEGIVVTEPGYCCQSKFYFAPAFDYHGITIPDQPTPEQVMAAKDHLNELYSEFPFEDDASRENNLATLITAVIRPIIDDVVPMAVYDKPNVGIGASFLADIISGITAGRLATMTSAAKSDEEWDKRIIGLLKGGSPLVVLNNCEGEIYNAPLASVLTSKRYGGRTLGVNDMNGYPNNATWIINGINLLITHDLIRRVFWIRLISNDPRPYTRTGWKIENIRQHAIDHRYEYLTDILTIVKAWFVAGKPKPNPEYQMISMGGFEVWQGIVGGIMHFIGCKEFLKNLDENIAEVESHDREIEEFIEELFNAFPLIKDDPNAPMRYTSDFSVKEIIPILDPNYYTPGKKGVRIEKMPYALQAIQRKEPEKFTHVLGRSYLRKYTGRMLPSGFKIEKVKDDKHLKVSVYRVAFKKPDKKQQEKGQEKDSERLEYCTSKCGVPAFQKCLKEGKEPGTCGGSP